MRLLEQKARDSEALLEISQAVNSTLDTDEIMRLIVNRIAEHIPVNRCSITGIDDVNGCGYVLASSDVPAINSFRIDLKRYPEIREVIRTGQSLIVENMKTHPLMEEVRDAVMSLDFNTLLVLPVIYHKEVIGTLVLRTLRDKNAFTPRELKFCQLVANVSAVALKNARLFERAREESNELREVKEQLERELREKEVFETLFAHASEGLIVLNVLGEPEYINDSALQILGTTRDVAMNAIFADFLAEDNCAEALENHINFFLGKEYRSRLDLRVKSPDGGTRWVSISISSHRLGGEFAIISLNDVTEERMNRRHVEECNARLQELGRLKSEFINIATHELRTPVTILQSYCQLLEEETCDLSADQQRYLDGISETCVRLSTLITQMLDIGKLEAVSSELQLRKARIDEPIDEVIASLKPLAAMKKQSIVVDRLPVGVMADFDRDTIVHLLTNLLDNAIKFTPDGGEIRLSIGASNGCVLVTVADTGIGIPEKYRKRVFDEFWRVRDGELAQHGAGLGLAICKKIIDAHNGRIWVDSATGKGCRITFSLPSS